MKYVKLFLRLLMGMFSANFGVVESKRVYRSAQAWHMYLYWPFLRLKTVINLSHKPKTDRHDKFEQWYCKLLKINYITHPTITPGDGFAESYEELKSCDKPVLVHCEGGKDRTGILIAVYKREVLKCDYYDMVSDWIVHLVPGEGWLIFMFDRWGK